MSQEIEMGQLGEIEHGKQLETGIIGIVANIAWAHNRWKGFDKEGSKKKRKYGFEYVKQTGMAHEWWNFYENFDPRYYYGHVESKGKLSKFKKGLVIFVSRNVDDGNFYFVGFYENAEYSKDGFETKKVVRDLLPEEFKADLRELLGTGEISGEPAEYLKRVLSENLEYFKSKLRAEKTLSTVFLPEAYVKFSPKEIGLKKFGQNKIVYIGENETIKPENVYNLLLKAKQQHEALLNDPGILDEKKQEAKRIIEKIEGVLKEYFGGKNMEEKLKKIYLEITKPPGKPYKENHVGRFLWSPADQKYRDGREGKMGLLKPGDIILHDVNGKIVGFSTVKEKVKDVSKKDIIKIFTEEGIWSEKYSKKFAENWFKKSSNGRFYLVRLKDFREFKKKRGYTELNNLPGYNRLQGVYLTEISPKVLEELNISFNGDVNDQNQEITERGKKKTLLDYLRSEGYLYPEHLIAQFYTALKTKGFVILSGLTGTGKTKIAQELAELLDQSKDNFLFLPVRPDWRDSKPLLGYYNPLTGEYHKTPLLELILRAKEDYEKNRENAMPYFIILDEMNLAHVEYYFADFLSVLESGRDENGFTKESIPLHDIDRVEKEQKIPKKIKLPPNLYIIGTVNMDETTYSFSPKVLDRAFTIELHDVDLEKYPPEETKLSQEERENLRKKVLDDLRRGGKFSTVYKKGKEDQEKDDVEKALEEFKNVKSGKYWQILKQLDEALEPYDLHFGYRVVDEIALFFQNAKESWKRKIVEFKSDDEIFNLALLMKVLPKFHGNRKKLEKPLLLLLKLAKEGTLNKEEVHKKVDELFKDIFGTENTQKKIDEVVKELTNPSNIYVFRHTAKKVLRMLRQLYEIGFASFN